MMVNSYASTSRDSQWTELAEKGQAMKIVRAREIRYISREGAAGNLDD